LLPRPDVAVENTDSRPSLSQDLADEDEALRLEYNAICDSTDEDLTPEQQARIKQIDARFDKIDESRGEPSWLPESLSIAGAVVSLDYNGQVQVERGLVLPGHKPKPIKTVTQTELAQSRATPSGLVTLRHGPACPLRRHAPVDGESQIPVAALHDARGRAGDGPCLRRNPVCLSGKVLRTKNETPRRH
jgi:hypothetical protein